jgi:hypothetical protein
MNAAIQHRVRVTAWALVAVIVALTIGAACFIAKNGHKSRTVLHSELREGEISWT